MAMNGVDYEELRRFAVHLTALAGLRCECDAGKVEVERKSDDSEVTCTDLSIQATLAEHIAGAFPGHALLAEEDIGPAAGLAPPGEARYCWVIDPLDGTRNFARGLPCYATAIGVLEDGVPVAGVIRDHPTRTTYSAARGRGAWVGERRLAVSTSAFDGRAVVSFQPAHTTRAYERAIDWLRVVNVRSLGSTAIHLALVAAGALDGAYGEDCYLWDVAAGAVMIEEAGGILTDPKGEAIFPFDLRREPRRHVPFLAGGPTMHGQLLARLGQE
jgi:myo-inositol-1(or 4)-monophosphatase